MPVWRVIQDLTPSSTSHYCWLWSSSDTGMLHLLPPPLLPSIFPFELQYSYTVTYPKSIRWLSETPALRGLPRPLINWLDMSEVCQTILMFHHVMKWTRFRGDHCSFLDLLMTIDSYDDRNILYLPPFRVWIMQFFSSVWCCRRSKLQA